MGASERDEVETFFGRAHQQVNSCSLSLVAWLRSFSDRAECRNTNSTPSALLRKSRIKSSIQPWYSETSRRGMIARPSGTIARGESSRAAGSSPAARFATMGEDPRRRFASVFNPDQPRARKIAPARPLGVRAQGCTRENQQGSGKARTGSQRLESGRERAAKIREELPASRRADDHHSRLSKARVWTRHRRIDGRIGDRTRGPHGFSRGGTPAFASTASEPASAGDRETC